MDYDLRTVDGLISVVTRLENKQGEQAVLRDAGSIHCHTCSGECRVDAHRLALAYQGSILRSATFFLICRQCGGTTTAVLYPIVGDDFGLALLHDKFGDAPANSPLGLAYYLDQARRSEAAGARSAAIAMYRSALDHVLHDQGFTSGTVAEKIAALEDHRDRGPGAPAWLDDLDADFLAVIKELAAASTDPDVVPVPARVAADRDLVRVMEATFAALLDLVYLRDARQKEYLARLQAARKPTTGSEKRG